MPLLFPRRLWTGPPQKGQILKSGYIIAPQPAQGIIPSPFGGVGLKYPSPNPSLLSPPATLFNSLSHNFRLSISMTSPLKRKALHIFIRCIPDQGNGFSEYDEAPVIIYARPRIKAAPYCTVKTHDHSNSPLICEKGAFSYTMNPQSGSILKG